MGLSKVQSNILPRLQLVCLYWGCYDHFQEMTSGIRPDSQEMNSHVLLFPPIIFNLSSTDRFLCDAGVWCEPIFYARVLLLVLNFPNTLWVDSDKISCWSLTGNIICCLSLFMLGCYFWRTNHGSISVDCFPLYCECADVWVCVKPVRHVCGL